MRKPVIFRTVSALSAALVLSCSVCFAETSDVPQDIAESQEVVFTSADRKKDVIFFQVGKASSVVFGKKVKIDSENAEVVPYLSNDRTYVPLRFLCEKLGAEVECDKEDGGCVVTKDDNEIRLAFGSAEFTVNGEAKIFDVPVEVVHDRTMVPVRFISEELGYDVFWNEPNKAVVISPSDNPWDINRSAERSALKELIVSLFPFMG